MADIETIIHNAGLISNPTTQCLGCFREALEGVIDECEICEKMICDICWDDHQELDEWEMEQ